MRLNSSILPSFYTWAVAQARVATLGWPGTHRQTVIVIHAGIAGPFPDRAPSETRIIRAEDLGIWPP